MSLKVSIITVTMNCADTVLQTIRSTSAQTYNLIEQVFIDGKSTDATLKIIRNHSLTNSIIYSEPDNGIYDAMNKGIKNATGDLVYFLNADDSFHDQNVVKDVVQLYKSNPSVELVYGNVIYKQGIVEDRREYGHISKCNLLYENLCHQSVFVRRELFSRYGSFDLKYHINADYDWLLKVFYNNTNTSYLDRYIAYFNPTGFHSQSIQKMRRERRLVKYKYKNPIFYFIGYTIYRIKRKLKEKGVQKSVKSSSLVNI